MVNRLPPACDHFSITRHYLTSLRRRPRRLRRGRGCPVPPYIERPSNHQAYRDVEKQCPHGKPEPGKDECDRDRKAQPDWCSSNSWLGDRICRTPRVLDVGSCLNSAIRWKWIAPAQCCCVLTPRAMGSKMFSENVVRVRSADRNSFDRTTKLIRPFFRQRSIDYRTCECPPEQDPQIWLNEHQ